MAVGFLQTAGAQVLRKFVQIKQSMLDADRQEILSFLSNEQNSEYAPLSGKITGILKEMGDKMTKDLTAAIIAENEEKTADAEIDLDVIQKC